jgi:membrane protease YdiL (CAAX protease family)
MTGRLWMGLVLCLLLAGAIGLRVRGAKHRVRAERSAAAKAQGKNSPLTFFALVLVLSIPFWLIGAATDLQLIAGLPASALMAFCPMAAALMLVYRKHKTAGVMALLTRAFDFRRVKAKRWYIPVLFLMPGVSVVVYLLMHAMAMPLPAPQVTALPALLLLLAFFVGALGEELGWSGYALDPLQSRWAALSAGLILGGVALVWHLPPLLALHRAPAWIAWWCLYAIGSRILIVWLYNNTGESVFAVALFHATLNLSYVLFPVEGSHFDMRLGGLVTAFAATVVTVIWGPATLARYRQT